MFTLGFEKISMFDHSNQGLEFKTEDTNPTANVGPGGMAPTGIPSYQPAENGSPNGKKKNKMGDVQVAQLMFGKLGSAGTDALSNMGSGSTADEGIVTGLKYDNDSGKYPQDLGADEKESRRHLKKYRKAASK